MHTRRSDVHQTHLVDQCAQHGLNLVHAPILSHKTAKENWDCNWGVFTQQRFLYATLQQQRDRDGPQHLQRRHASPKQAPSGVLVKRIGGLRSRDTYMSKT